MEEIEEAARSANAHQFITENLGKGYDTDVGLRGSALRRLRNGSGRLLGSG